MDAFNGSIISKLPGVETSIFAVMSKLAIDNQAINLSQGFPDFDVSPDLINLIAKNMRKGNNQYAPMPGLPILRERIAEKIYKSYGASYNPDTEITVTAGATQALFTAISAFVRGLFPLAYPCLTPSGPGCTGPAPRKWSLRS